MAHQVAGGKLLIIVVGTRDAARQHESRSDFAGGVRQIEDPVLLFDDGALRPQGVDLLGCRTTAELFVEDGGVRVDPRAILAEHVEH